MWTHDAFQKIQEYSSIYFNPTTIKNTEIKDKQFKITTILTPLFILLFSYLFGFFKTLTIIILISFVFIVFLYYVMVINTLKNKTNPNKYKPFVGGDEVPIINRHTNEVTLRVLATVVLNVIYLFDVFVGYVIKKINFKF